MGDVRANARIENDDLVVEVRVKADHGIIRDPRLTGRMNAQMGLAIQKLALQIMEAQLLLINTEGTLS